MAQVPHRSCDRKVNEFVKRVRAAHIHVLILGHLRKQMPTMMGKQKAQDKLVANLEEEFYKVRASFCVSKCVALPLCFRESDGTRTMRKPVLHCFPSSSVTRSYSIGLL